MGIPWWETPKLRTDADEGEERRVGWLELFFDLFFVVIVAELSHKLSTDLSASGLRDFIFLFVPVWWVWIAGTYYTERFETEGLDHRFFTFLQMLPITGMAVFIHDGLGRTFHHFAVSFIISRVLVTVLWMRGGYHDPRARVLTRRFGIGYGLAALFYTVSLFVTEEIRFWPWGIGLVVEFLTPILTHLGKLDLPALGVHKLAERYGLFVLIVLGETLAGVARAAAANHHMTVLNAFAAFLGLAMAFGLFSIYFDFIARRPPRPGLLWTISWSHLHLALLIGFTVFGVGLLNIVGRVEDTDLPAATRWFLCGAGAVSLVVLGVIETTLHRMEAEPTHPNISPVLKILGGAACLSIGFLGEGLSAITVLSLLLGLVLIQIFYYFSVWYVLPGRKKSNIQEVVHV